MNEQSAHRKATKFPYFEEETSAEVVNARMAPDSNPRLREVMTAIVKHLHVAVKEIEPTQDEWLAAIKFLTEKWDFVLAPVEEGVAERTMFHVSGH